MPMPAQKPGKSRQDFATPWKFIEAVEARFGRIEFDLAASKDNAKAARYFTERDNALIQDWSVLKGNLWLNPPFGNIEPFVRKCAETPLAVGRRIICLTPASIGSNWFARHVHRKALVLGLNPRISFDGIAAYPKDLMLFVYSGLKIEFDVWRWC